MWNSNIGEKITFCYNTHKDSHLNQQMIKIVSFTGRFTPFRYFVLTMIMNNFKGQKLGNFSSFVNFTTHKRSFRKVIFHRCVSVHRMWVCLVPGPFWGWVYQGIDGYTRGWVYQGVYQGGRYRGVGIPGVSIPWGRYTKGVGILGVGIPEGGYTGDIPRGQVYKIIGKLCTFSWNYNVPSFVFQYNII